MIGALWALLVASGHSVGEGHPDETTPRLSMPRGPGRVFLQHHDAQPLPKPASQKKRRKLARRGKR